MENLTFTTQSQILHHGIKGQSWGVRNGPPYPLDEKNANRIVNDANKRLETNKQKKKKYGKEYNSYRSKKVAAAAVAGGSTAASIAIGPFGAAVPVSLKVAASAATALVAASAQLVVIKPTYDNSGKQYKHAKENVKLNKKQLETAKKYAELSQHKTLTDDELYLLSEMKKELKLK